MNCKFVHTNLVARDWKKLVQFYEEVFGCTQVPPERDLSGEWLDQAVSLKNAHIRGIHLRLPVYGEQGPTLEIFQYEPALTRQEVCSNTPGFSHIAFAVDDVAATAERMISHGGSALGELVQREIQGAGTITFRYMRDPEGNIIELQCWEA